jgi:hypothetical protein
VSGMGGNSAGNSGKGGDAQSEWGGYGYEI